MTNATSASASAAAVSPGIETGTKKAVLTEIRTKWGKFSEQELSALKSNDDLVTQLVAKYNLDRPQAQREGPPHLTPTLSRRLRGRRLEVATV
jgi:hypothetical protein